MMDDVYSDRMPCILRTILDSGLFYAVRGYDRCVRLLDAFRVD